MNHSANEYVTAGGFTHFNTAENFFSILKRGVIGTYHHMSEVTRTEGKRLTYRRSDNIAA